MTPDKETICQIVELYKQWCGEWTDQALSDYVQEHWQEENTGDPEQDLEDIINELKIIIKKIMKEEIYDIVFERTMNAADDYLDGRTLKGKELLAIVNAVGKAYATYICIVADIMELDIDKFSANCINSVLPFIQDLWSTQKIKKSQPIID